MFFLLYRRKIAIIFITARGRVGRKRKNVKFAPLRKNSYCIHQPEEESWNRKMKEKLSTLSAKSHCIQKPSKRILKKNECDLKRRPHFFFLFEASGAGMKGRKGSKKRNKKRGQPRNLRRRKERHSKEWVSKNRKLKENKKYKKKRKKEERTNKREKNARNGRKEGIIEILIKQRKLGAKTTDE